MKKVFSLIVVMAVALTVAAQEQAPAPKVIEIDQQTYDFGTVAEEVGKITHIFGFKNIGTATLTIKSVKASCGCTTPEWSKDPIATGETAKVNVTYTATGRPYAFHKSVTLVFTDGTNDFTEVVFIKGTVTPKVTAAQ